MWNEKLEALANEMMETFQKQGMTCMEVDAVLMNIGARVNEQKRHAAEKQPFNAIPFRTGGKGEL